MRGPKFIRILGQIFNRFMRSFFNQFLGSKKCHFLDRFWTPFWGPKIVIFGVHFGPQIGTHFGGGTPPKMDWIGPPPPPPIGGGPRGGSGGGVPPVPPQLMDPFWGGTPPYKWIGGGTPP